jgi:hypothetical protein
VLAAEDALAGREKVGVRPATISGSARIGRTGPACRTTRSWISTISLESGRLCRCGSDTVAASATDRRYCGLKLGAIAAIATLRRLLGGRLSCAPVHVAGGGNPRLDSGHITRSGLLRHLWNKQQGRQNQELLHGSHSPMTRSIIMIFWVVVKFRKEAPLAQR